GDEWLARMGLTHLSDAPAGSLSIGQQRLLELAMNLVVDPEFLLLDEPIAGVHPVIRRQIAETLHDLRSRGRTLLVIEHHMPFVMGLCDKIVVMDHGMKIAEGTPAARSPGAGPTRSCGSGSGTSRRREGCSRR